MRFEADEQKLMLGAGGSRGSECMLGSELSWSKVDVCNRGGFACRWLYLDSRLQVTMERAGREAKRSAV